MTYNSKRQYFENYLPPRSSCIQRAILEMRWISGDFFGLEKLERLQGIPTGNFIMSSNLYLLKELWNNNFSYLIDK